MHDEERYQKPTTYKPLFFLKDKETGKKYYIEHDGQDNVIVCAYLPSSDRIPLPMATLDYTVANGVLHAMIADEMVDIKLPRDIWIRIRNYCGIYEEPQI